MKNHLTNSTDLQLNAVSLTYLFNSVLKLTLYGVGLIKRLWSALKV